MVSHSSLDPFWGPPTCKANFCEEDYAMTRYIGEFVNTLTNLVYIVYAIYGIRSLRRKKNASIFRAIPYWGLMGVGICSAAFHASLKYHTQMMDDLSMQLTTVPVLHRVLTVDSSRKQSMVMAILLGALLISFAIFHVVTDELILHSSSFVLSVTVIGVRTIQLIKLRTEPDSAARRKIWGIVIFGAVIFNVGYIVWLIDRWACGQLRSTREKIGLPWAFLLELHGWWHICTGIGAYIFIAVVDHLASGDDLQDIDESFAWPAPWASRSIFAGRDVAVDKKQ